MPHVKMSAWNSGYIKITILMTYYTILFIIEQSLIRILNLEIYLTFTS